jgi:hypothetical protein
MPRSLAWCLRDLPRGFELTQSEAAASIGMSERQLRRTEAKLLAALRGVRALRREFFSSENGTDSEPDVRSPDANMHDDGYAAPAVDEPRASPLPLSSGHGERRRARLLSPERLPRRFREEP